MQIDRNKFQQNTVEVNRTDGSLPQPVKSGRDAADVRPLEKKKLHPKAYEDAERWDGMG